MTSRLFFLLLIPASLSFAQDFNYINPNATRGRNIQNIDVSFSNIQYTDAPVSISAMPDNPAFGWDWEVRRTLDNSVAATSTDQNPSFTGLGVGYYDVVLQARNSVDYYPTSWRRAFRVMPPKVDEGDADLVVDMSSSDVLFYNMTGQDWSDKVIYLKGSNSSAILQFHNLRGTPGHPVIIQKSNDNTTVEWTCRPLSPHALWFSSNNSTDGCRYIVVNGFNNNGTPGIKVNGNASSTQVVFTDGKFTNIELIGMTVEHVTTADAAAISFIPTVGASNNITNWYIDSLIMYRVDVVNGGEEGFYVGYNNQSPQSGNVPPQGRGMVIGRCSVDNCGRDAAQPGGMLDFEIHDNYFQGWGKQKEASHESAISQNAGSAGVISGNYAVNGKMFYNLQSGPYPYDVQALETQAHPTLMEGNIFACGTYDHVGGGDEAFAMYGQNHFTAGPGAWNFYAINNIFDTDLKLMEVNWANSSWLGTDWAFVNNVIIKTGNAGDWPELNFVGDAAGSVTGTTVNDLVRERGSDLSDCFFTDYDAHDYTITSFSSVIYQGSPTDLAANYSEWAQWLSDHLWFPLLVPGYGYVFGPYTGYQKRRVTPP
jgi:hypothetical protein